MPMGENIKYLKNTIKNTLNEFKLGTNKMFKEFFNKETNKKQRANMWSFSRLIIPIITIILSIIAIATSSAPLFITTGVIAGMGAVTDALDGASSRKHKSTSEYGKILDQVTDKVFAGIVGINLLFLNFNYISLLIGELLIALVNTSYKIKYHDLSINSTMMGKVKEWPLYFSLALGYLSTINPALLLVSNISILLAGTTQLLTTASYIKNNNKEVKILKQNKNAMEIKDIENNNEKELSIEKNKTRLDRIKDLRDLLNEIIEQKNEVELTNDFQKTKKL